MSNKIEEEYYGPNQESVRLNKYISESGFCSRREADRHIQGGRVYIDGKKASCGMKVSPGQRVTIGNKEILNKNKMVVLAVNKPAGIICTGDLKTKNNIIRFLDYPIRLTYAGRLDKDSEGLLLMTNNGNLIDGIMRARNYHEKEYEVIVDRPVTEAFIKKMCEGVRITDEEKGLDETTRPCKAEIIGKYKIRIILTQGLNRQIRRMCAALGYKVERLRRIRVMNIGLHGLKPGQYRELTDQELNEMYEILKGERQ